MNKHGSVPPPSGSATSVSAGVAPLEGRVACPADDRTDGPSPRCELDLRSGPTTAWAAAPELANYPCSQYKPARRHEAGPGRELRRGASPMVRPTGDPSPQCERSLWFCFAAAVALTVVVCAGLSLNLHRSSPPAQCREADPGRELRRGTSPMAGPTGDPSPRCERNLWFCFAAVVALAVAVCAGLSLNLHRPGPPGPGRAPRGGARLLGGPADGPTPRCERGLWSRLNAALAVVSMSSIGYTLPLPCRPNPGRPPAGGPRPPGAPTHGTPPRRGPSPPLTTPQGPGYPRPLAPAPRPNSTGRWRAVHHTTQVPWAGVGRTELRWRRQPPLLEGGLPGPRPRRPLLQKRPLTV